MTRPARSPCLWPVGGGLALSAGVLLAGSVGGAACAPVPPEPIAAQPINTCPEHACDLYQQPSQGTQSPLAATCGCVEYEHPTTATIQKVCAAQSTACVSSSSESVFLRVDVPAGSLFAPGLSFFIMDPLVNQAAFPAVTRVTCTNTIAPCLSLPEASALHGLLRASYDATQTVGFNLGNGPMSETTLPVTATVTPLFSFVTPPVYESPEVAGILLAPPLVSQITVTSNFLEYPGDATEPGPNGSVGVGFFAAVPVGMYALTLLPTAPFDAFFPPFAVTPPPTVAISNSFAFYELTIDPPAARATSVRSATALDGMVAYLRNAAGVRISTRVPLHGQDAATGIPLQLQTSGQPANLAGDFFIIAPENELDPGGRATFTNTALSITTGGLGTEQTYPQLPPPVTVAGQVLATGLVPTAANVFLTSTGIDRVDQSAPDNTSLSYVTSFATDACGKYSVMLPPGTYSARIAPVQGKGAQTCGLRSSIAPAQTVTSLAVATTPTEQNGKSLQLDDAISVTGTCKVADGRPLALATVVLSASTSLAIDPGTIPAPRTFTAVTATDGSFSVPVDPGVYDVSVQPAAGSNLPWVVTRRQTVLAPSFALADQVVPAPIVRPYSIYAPQPEVIPVVNAVVTAYVLPVSAVDGGAPGLAAVPVAQAITDQSGTVNLLLSGTTP